MTQPAQYPVNKMEDVLRACQAGVPLEPDDKRRYDFEALRGNEPVVLELATTLIQVLDPDKYHHAILSGHRGSGKSTELLKLKEWADKSGFLSVWIEVDLFFGQVELQFSDLYLLAAQKVEEAMLEMTPSTPLPADKVKHVTQWFAEKTRENSETVKSALGAKGEAKVGGKIPLLGELIASFTAGITAGSERHMRVRERLRQAPNELIDLTNDLLQTANTLLKGVRKPKGLLLLFDNLDRYDTRTIDDLLLKKSTLIDHLGCHALFTVPVELRCNTEKPYWDYYSPSPTLPMIALRKRGTRWADTVEASDFEQDAVQAMVNALERRISLALFENPLDAALLAKMSGGCMRDLLHLVNVACGKSTVDLDNPATQITSRAVRRAIVQERGERAKGLHKEECKRLTSVIKRRADSQESSDELSLKLLAKRQLLEYKDERGEWIDIHPLLIETEMLQHDGTQIP